MEPIEINGKKFKCFNSLILHLSKQRPIAYNTELSELAESAIAGLFLSQLLYWLGKGHKEGYIYKTVKDFQKETCLIRSEQDRAIKIWRGLEVLDVKLKGIPPKRHFKVNTNKLLRLLGYCEGDIARINDLICRYWQIEK
ncbi:MAG: hypothetical protein A2271_02400 [Candidatus Moranbacteria bacterium RIFOXYA12_FULL_35_19]|nr:MAG: hypothetical protein UR78_C0008G0028 [Candidatus Moranbacteria bacterium GW2011_GWF2_35_39]OGI30250.1 MAG: hypothetical protein A2343_00100 [Candidatus Moranbacteria bacterium RIFOXYB12_FULL_35_8]OGI35390.1 MAG: hypothetical protein A2271_02400 [Candidatus Moranbacteria bacterium RIFOXYA12_FULL_35_19]